MEIWRQHARPRERVSDERKQPSSASHRARPETHKHKRPLSLLSALVVHAATAADPLNRARSRASGLGNRLAHTPSVPILRTACGHIRMFRRGGDKQVSARYD